MFDGKIETFVKVAACGSFTKAAEALYLTPTAVMKQINALEESLSVSLFERSNRGLKLTKAGGEHFAGRAVSHRLCRPCGAKDAGDRRGRL